MGKKRKLIVIPDVNRYYNEKAFTKTPLQLHIENIVTNGLGYEPVDSQHQMERQKYIESGAKMPKENQMDLERYLACLSGRDGLSEDDLEVFGYELSIIDKPLEVSRRAGDIAEGRKYYILTKSRNLAALYVRKTKENNDSTQLSLDLNRRLEDSYEYDLPL